MSWGPGVGGPAPFGCSDMSQCRCVGVGIPPPGGGDDGRGHTGRRRALKTFEVSHLEGREMLIAGVMGL
jgi:hypothetical protein